MLGIVALNSLIDTSFGHSLPERFAVGIQDCPELKDASLVSEMQRLYRVIQRFKSVERCGALRWEGVYVKFTTEDLETLQLIYPEDEVDDLKELLEQDYPQPFKLIRFDLVNDRDLFVISSDSPYFSIAFDLSKKVFLVPPKVMSQDLSEDFKTLASEIVMALQRSLEDALTNFQKYSEMVRTDISPENKIGRVRRSDLVKCKVINPTCFSQNEIEEFISFTPDLEKAHPLSLSLNDYLKAVQIALISIERAKPNESSIQSYQNNADGRDGGMLSLPLKSKDKFFDWCCGSKWKGQHPFEIIRGAHGHTAIHLSISPDIKSRQLQLILSGSFEGVADNTVRMALALSRAGIPVTLSELERHKARLLQEDWIFVSDSSGFLGETWSDDDLNGFDGIIGAQISYYDLVDHPEALRHVVWNDLKISRPL